MSAVAAETRGKHPLSDRPDAPRRGRAMLSLLEGAPCRFGKGALSRSVGVQGSTPGTTLSLAVPEYAL